MATQTRVPGAASSEVDFELERFERTAEDRIEIAGRWYGLRGRRFVRPVLNLHTGGSRRRAIALLEHKPWAADDGKTWIAAFAWPKGTGEVEGAELEVGPGLVVELPAPGGTPNSAGRVSALRPHAPISRPLETSGASAGVADVGPRDGGGDSPVRGGARERSTEPRVPERFETPQPQRREPIATALAERDEAIASRDEAERERVVALVDRDDALSRRDAALRDVDRAVVERTEATAERDRVQTELDRVTRERDHAHAERNRALQDSEAIARDRDQAAAERDAARAELSRALPARDQAVRERDAEAARADQAESERDTAYAERKSAVAQRDRARRERDRAMRAAGVEPPSESPHLPAAPLMHRRLTATQPFEVVDDREDGDDAEAAGAGGSAVAGGAAAAGGSGAAGAGESAVADGAAGPDGVAAASAGGVAQGSAAASGAADAPAVAGGAPEIANRRGAPLASRPIKRIGAAGGGQVPEPKPLLTPVDGSRPRRLSRTRRAPSAPARWAVLVATVLLLIAIAFVLILILLGRV